MLTIGLTGNYGMGKSFVLSVFREMGVMVLNSDEIVNSLFKDKGVIFEVKKILGENTGKKQGAIDKKEIAKIIFNSDKLRYKLEVLLHPMVFNSIENSLRKIKEKKKLCIVEVPLLFEGEYADKFNKTITVFTTQKTALERLMRNGISRSNALKRLKAQLPIQIKKKRADYLIDNNGSKQKTREQVGYIYRELLDEISRQ